MADLPKDHPQDGRKYHVGDHVEFTDDSGKRVPGVVHGVRYQQGRYELVGAHHEVPSDPSSPIVPGTGEMQLIPGTEGERHSFEYIMVHEHEHKAWWDTENANQKHLKDENHHLVKPHPELKQHLRVYEADELDNAKA